MYITDKMSFPFSMKKKEMKGHMTNPDKKKGMGGKMKFPDGKKKMGAKIAQAKELFAKDLPPALEVLIKKTVENKRTGGKRHLFPAGGARMGSSLYPGNQSDLDIVVGYATTPIRGKIINAIKDMMGLIVGKSVRDFAPNPATNIDEKQLTTYMAGPHNCVVVRLVGTLYHQEKGYSRHGPTIMITDIVIGVVDIVFTSTSNLPIPLFNKGGLMQIVGTPSVFSRLGGMDVSEILNEFKVKKTSLVRQRVEELLPKQKNYLLMKIVWLLLRGWKIRNCVLECKIPQDKQDIVSSSWLNIMSSQNFKQHVLDTMLQDITFFVQTDEKKIPFSIGDILEEKFIDEDGIFHLPNGTRVPAFSWQKDWTKKLVMTCVICKDDLDGTKSFWRTSKCSHVVCEDCHGRARELGRASFDDGDDNSCVSRHDFSKVCSTCKHTLFKQGERESRSVFAE